MAVKDEGKEVARMTYTDGLISGWCETNRKFVDHACEAVWGQKPPWQD
jgi:hypothetical protein